MFQKDKHSERINLDVYTLKAYKETMFTFIESTIFSRELANYLDDDEYGDLQQHLISYPEAGDIIPRFRRGS